MNTILNNGFEAKTEYITISLKEYVELVMKANYHDMVIDALYEDASLDYSGNDLRFDDETVKGALKVLDPEKYNEALYILKSERERKGQTNDAL